MFCAFKKYKLVHEHAVCECKFVLTSNVSQTDHWGLLVDELLAVLIGQHAFAGKERHAVVIREQTRVGCISLCVCV